MAWTSKPFADESSLPSPAQGAERNSDAAKDFPLARLTQADKQRSKKRFRDVNAGCPTAPVRRLFGSAPEPVAYAFQ